MSPPLLGLLGEGRSNFSLDHNHPEVLLKQVARLHPRVFDSHRPGVEPKNFIFNKFQGDADAVGPGYTFRESQLRRPFLY